MLQHVKVGDILKNRAGDLATIIQVDHNPDYPILYKTSKGYKYSVTIEGSYYPNDTAEYPLDIIDPTIYNTDSATAESLTSVEPVNYIESRTTYNLGHIITLPNGTQLYQSNTGRIQLIPQLGASI
jgi:hypothetical protein